MVVRLPRIARGDRITHFLGQIDQPRLREQIVHEIQREFHGKVVWGEDLMQLTLAGPTIAKIEGY